MRIAVYNENNHYYINRGFPVSWAGVSEPSLKVKFPVVKAPFLLMGNEGKILAKIIDLSVFLPLFLFVFLGIYIFLFTLYFFVFSKVENKNKFSNIILIFVYIFLLMTDRYLFLFLLVSPGIRC